MSKIDSKEFTYKKHEANWWSAFGFSFSESIKPEKLIKAIDDYAIGYCDGSKLEIKPKEKSYAIMFNVEGDKFWFHIDNSENTILKDFVKRLK